MTQKKITARQFSGDLLKQFREKVKLTQTQVALELMKLRDEVMSAQSVSEWERGAYDPSANSLADLATVLDVSMDAFFCPKSGVTQSRKKAAKRSVKSAAKQARA